MSLRREADDLVVAAHRLRRPRSRASRPCGRAGSGPTTVMPSSSSSVPPTSCARAITTSSLGWRRMVSELRVSMVSLLRYTCRTRRRARRRGGRWRRNPSRCRGRASSAAMAWPSRDRHARRRDVVELRDVLDPARVRHRAVSDTCSSIRKCGQTATLKVSARCATLSQGVMPPIRAQSTCTIEQARRSRYSRKWPGDRAIRRRRSASSPCGGQLDMAGEVLGRQRLLEPGEVERLEARARADRLGDREAPGWRRP